MFPLMSLKYNMDLGVKRIFEIVKTHEELNSIQNYERFNIFPREEVMLRGWAFQLDSLEQLQEVI